MEIKPQAMAIPKETDHLELGKYGPIYPKSPVPTPEFLVAWQRKQLVN